VAVLLVCDSSPLFLYFKENLLSYKLCNRRLRSFSTVFPPCNLPSQINVFTKRVKTYTDTDFFLICTGTGINFPSFFDTGIGVRTEVAIRKMVFVLDCFGKKKPKIECGSAVFEKFLFCFFQQAAGGITVVPSRNCLRARR
jgi:hypothetical protein